MAEYQSFYNRLQVKPPVYPGVPIEGGEFTRDGEPIINYWLGKLGDSQIGPFYLGKSGLAALICGLIAFEIIGLNMWASVNWDPIEFVRQLFWLSLEPPAPEYGLSFPPLNDGGWWLVAGFFLTASIFLWWIRVYTRAAA